MEVVMSNISQQKLRRLHVAQLKNLHDLDLDFSESPLTAIVGINGSGKSTVLHALACCYKPVNGSKEFNYKFSYFFTPTSDSIWQGSNLTIYYDQRVDKTLFENISTTFSKTTDRWSPKYDRRPSRNVFYLGIDTCVPRIEEERQNSFISYTTTTLTDGISQLVREKAGVIMNRDYSSYNLHKATRTNYFGVEHEQIRYSSLSMSAGEQRIFKILTQVFGAPKYSLILIDEIDLLMHTFALKRLVRVLHQRAKEKELQIVFTTHSPYILNENSLINIRHLYNTPSKTFCFSDTKPDTIYRMTGELTRPIELFVEDDLAQSIVNNIVESLNISKYVTVNRFGAAINCFSVAAGLALSNKLSSNCLFVLDGDEFRTIEQKTERINTVLTGNTAADYARREALLTQISQFSLPEGFSPERFIHNLLRELSGTQTHNQIIQTALEINKVDNNHKYVDDILERIGYPSREVGLSKVIDVVSAHPNWSGLIAPVREWLERIKDSVIEQYSTPVSLASL